MHKKLYLLCMATDILLVGVPDAFVKHVSLVGQRIGYNTA
jgi:hypothetical protein